MNAAELISKSGLPLALPGDIDIADIQLDSRKIGKGSLFIALRGSSADGARFIPDAFGRGASFVLTDSPAAGPGPNILFLENLREKTLTLLNVFHGNPLANLTCVGITGTNGKTTIARLSSALFRAAGHRVISLGTIDNRIGDDVFVSRLTTPDPVELMSMIKRGVAKGCDVLVMEASSHALSQDRVTGIPFRRALFTNLTQDHLDYHLTFEAYYAAKRRLFTELLEKDGMAIINADSPYGIRLIKETGCAVISFSQQPVPKTRAGEEQVLLMDSQLSLSRTEFEVQFRNARYRFSSSLVGKINLENLLAAVSLGFSMNLSPEVINETLGSITVPGRNEPVRLPGGGLAVIDYAHTPDALERIITSLRPLVSGRIITVFGCGGDRDGAKRPMMGRVAELHSDQVIITSDNPRTEEPGSIIIAIEKGMTQPGKALTIPDRAKAIARCLEQLRAGDCGIIAGKGHEDYQIVGQEIRHFSDREQVDNWIAQHSSGVKS